MSNEISPNDEAVTAEAIAPELTEEEKARVAAEAAAAAAEAERLAAEEAARKAEEEHRQLVAAQTIRAHQLIEYTFLVPNEKDVVDQVLATLEPEAVEAGRAQVKAEQDAIAQQLKSVVPMSPQIAAVVETPRKSKRGR